MSFLFYVPDNVGIGNLSRLLGIAGAVDERAPVLPILFLTDLSDTRLLKESPFPYYVLPSLKTAIGNLRRTQIYEESRSIGNQLMIATLSTHQPQLVIHDTAIRQSLFAAAEAQGCQQALILRHRTDLFQFLAHGRRYVEKLALIAFPHQRDEISDLDLPWLDQSRLMFAGPLLRRSRRDLDLEAIRTAYGITPDRFTIVISNGGGNAVPIATDDGFLSLTLAALGSIETALPPFRVIVITGPLTQPRVVAEGFSQGHLLVRDFELCLFDLFAAANLVIARGGYNTVLELQQLGVPAICVEAKRGLDDQAGRIERAAQQNPNIRMATLDLDDLRSTIREIASQPRWTYQPSEMPDEIAANKLALADRLLDLIGYPGSKP